MRLSLNKPAEYNRKFSLSNASEKINFKGGAQSLISNISSVMDNNRLLTSVSQNYDSNNILNLMRNRIGRAADVLFEHVKKDDLIKQGLIYEGDNIKFKSKRATRMLLDGVLYPIAKIPSYIFYWGLNNLKKIKAVKNSKWLASFEKTSFYKATHSYIKKDDKLNSLKGIMEIGAMREAMDEKMWNKIVLQNASKTFDPTVGNYNSVHERALTRIVTGFIPAFFLANDAHNLSILCNNNKKEAQTEKRLRFIQESKRIVSNAYIQLITLGALSKFINRSKAWFIGVTVGTILATEVYSRLSTGKKIHFINAGEAKAINAKENRIHRKSHKRPSFSQKANAPFNVNLESLNEFIKKPSADKLKESEKNLSENVQSKNNKNKSQSIISIKGLLKFFGAVILAGFALRYLKKIPAVDNLFKSVAKQYNKIYNKITMKPNHLQKTEFSKIIDKMRKCGFGEIADSYEKTVIDYQKLITLPKYIGNEIVDGIRNLGQSKKAGTEGFEEIATLLNNLVSGKNTKETLEILKNKAVKHNFDIFMQYLRKSGKTDLISKIEEINKGGKIDYGKIHKLLGKGEDEKYREIFENIFMTDDNSLKQSLLQKAQQALETNNLGHLWKSAEEKALKEINGKDFYDLGITKKPIIKDTIDFCLEPFKFVWKYSTLVYKLLFDIAGSFKPAKPLKGISEINIVERAISGLRKKTSMDDAAFTGMLNEKIVKGFNSTTMSKIANSELSALAKNASLFTTMYFLTADNYNMVMLKSNGENKAEADQKGQERFVQEMTRFFWQQLFINLFNNTFSSTYNSSLMGASAVNTASTTIGEICTRKAVGLPVNAVSKEEIIDLERRNLSGKGIKSKFFRFMSKLTGKKILSEREKRSNKK